MRVLVTSSAMAGHLGPLLPWVAALRRRGDDVVLVVPAAARERAEATGATVVLGGSPDPDEAGALWRRFRTADRREAAVIANREVFGRLHTAAMLPAVSAAVADHRPAWVLHEPTEYGGPIAAGRAGIPHAQVAISLAEVEWGSLDLAAPALAGFGAVVDALREAPYLTRFPAPIDPSPYRDTRRYRETTPAGGRDGGGPAHGDDAPLVYVTFGTVTSGIGLGVYRAAIEALGALPVRGLVSTGPGIDVAAFGTLPPRVRVVTWIEQDDVLTRATAVLSHGGSGTVLAALAAGVPQVAVSLFADQGHNARALARLGVGIVVDRPGDTAAAQAAYDPLLVESLEVALRRVLAHGPERAAARRVAAAWAAEPGPDELLAGLPG